MMDEYRLRRRWIYNADGTVSIDFEAVRE